MATATTWDMFLSNLRAAAPGSTVVVRGVIDFPEQLRPLNITVAEGVTIDAGPRWLEGQNAVFTQKLWFPSAHKLAIIGGVFRAGLAADEIDGFTISKASTLGAIKALKGRGFSVLNTHLSNGGIYMGGVLRATGPEQVFDVQILENHVVANTNDGIVTRGGGNYVIARNLVHGLRHEGGAHPDAGQFRAVFGEVKGFRLQDNEFTGNAQGAFFENAGGFFSDVWVTGNRIKVGFKRAISITGGVGLHVNNNAVLTPPCAENSPAYTITTSTYAEPPAGNTLNGSPWNPA